MSNAAQYTRAQLDELIRYYNDRMSFTPKVFPAQAQKITTTVNELFDEVPKLVARISRMSDAHKLTMLIRTYILEANTRNVAPNDDFLYAALNKFRNVVSDDFLAGVAAAEREKLEAAALKAQERAEKALAKEADKEEKRRVAAERAAERAAEKEAEKEEKKRQRAEKKSAEKAAGPTA